MIEDHAEEQVGRNGTAQRLSNAHAGEPAFPLFIVVELGNLLDVPGKGRRHHAAVFPRGLLDQRLRFEPIQSVRIVGAVGFRQAI